MPPKSAKPVDCDLCCKRILDGKDEALHCKGDGGCGLWFHRYCAGVSASLFKELSNSSEPFLCYVCYQRSQAAKEKDLRSEVAHLRSEIGKQQASKNAIDRKFNIVMYGLKECPNGTPRHKRISQDTNLACQIIKSIFPDMNDNAVSDWTRIGKYSEPKTRPLMVRFARSCDVATILSNRHKLSQIDYPNVSIRPYMSIAERKTEPTLLNENKGLGQALSALGEGMCIRPNCPSKGAPCLSGSNEEQVLLKKPERAGKMKTGLRHGIKLVTQTHELLYTALHRLVPSFSTGQFYFLSLVLLVVFALAIRSDTFKTHDNTVAILKETRDDVKALRDEFVKQQEEQKSSFFQGAYTTLTGMFESTKTGVATVTEKATEIVEGAANFVGETWRNWFGYKSTDNSNTEEL